MIGQVKLRYGTVTMQDDGAFASDDVPEIAQAMAGQWVLFRRHSRESRDSCRVFLREQADLLGAQLVLTDDVHENRATASKSSPS